MTEQPSHHVGRNGTTEDADPERIQERSHGNFLHAVYAVDRAEGWATYGARYSFEVRDRVLLLRRGERPMRTRLAWFLMVALLALPALSQAQGAPPLPDRAEHH